MRNILIDGNNMLYRAVGNTERRHKENPRYKRKYSEDGMDITAIHSFFSTLYYDTQRFQQEDTKFYIVWDRKVDPTATNWRNDINPLYKANRGTVDTSESKKMVFDLCRLVKQVCDAYGFHTVFPLTSECDDIINHLKNTLEGGCIIVSADEDFYQCVSANCSVYSPMKKILVTERNFEDYNTVSLENFVKWKSIKGDTSDNIKGLYRYGDKKSKKLVENWEVGSKKLSEEQLEIIKETMSIIDLDHKPLADREILLVSKQIKPKTRLGDLSLGKVLDNFGVHHTVRTLWANFFLNQDLA